MTDPLIYARAIHFAATLQVAGVAFFLVFIAEPAFRGANNDHGRRRDRPARLTWIARISLALALISGAAWFDLTAAAMSGQPVADVFSQGVWWTVLSDTTFGNDWLVRFVLACLLAGSFDPSLAERRIKSRSLKSALVISAAAFAGVAGLVRPRRRRHRRRSDRPPDRRRLAPRRRGGVARRAGPACAVAESGRA